MPIAGVFECGGYGRLLLEIGLNGFLEIMEDGEALMYSET